MVHIERHQSACLLGDLDRAKHRGQRRWAECRSDAGEVQHLRVGDHRGVEVGRGQSRGGTAVPVVPDPPGRAVQLFLDHQSGPGVGIDGREYANTFSADLPGDQRAEGVVPDAADPGDGDIQPRQADGHVRFGATDTHRQFRAAPQVPAGRCGDQRHGLAERHHRPGAGTRIRAHDDSLNRTLLLPLVRSPATCSAVAASSMSKVWVINGETSIPSARAATASVISSTNR